MAVASLIVGIMSGFVMFVAALATGHGFVVALSMYVICGLFGAMGIAAMAALRAYAQINNRVAQPEKIVA